MDLNCLVNFDTWEILAVYIIHLYNENTLSISTATMSNRIPKEVDIVVAGGMFPSHSFLEMRHRHSDFDQGGQLGLL